MSNYHVELSWQHHSQQIICFVRSVMSHRINKVFRQRLRIFQCRSEWTDCIIDKIFKNIEIVKSITTALKSILKLVKWQSLVAKCCKM